MGPFPHDAPPAVISDGNPMGTDGFAFVEFAHPEPATLKALLETMGYVAVARHRRRAVTHYAQGEISYLVNEDAATFAGAFRDLHGPCAVGMGFKVVDPKHAFDRALSLGAAPLDTQGRPTAVDSLALSGIGGSALYLVARDGSSWEDEFEPIPGANRRPAGVGLAYMDHLTHNVHRGRMDVWTGFYERLFNFRQIRFFDIEGKLTGLFSRALTSPCGKIRIPINESADENSQIEEYLRIYRGEGIQHIACGSSDIYATVEALRERGLPFMPAPPVTYYERIEDRLPGHGEPVERMKATGILIDGEGVVSGGSTKVLLQIFSGTVLGPIFFEFIQRKGDDGFGEGNFRALFESIEEDQIRRGVLKLDAAE